MHTHVRREEASASNHFGWVRPTARPPLSPVSDQTGWHWQGCESPKLITVFQPTQIFCKPQTNKCNWTFTHRTTTSKMPHLRQNALTRRRPKILHNGLPYLEVTQRKILTDPA